MSPVWVAFWVGAFIGSVVTLVAMSCLIIARREDDEFAMAIDRERIRAEERQRILERIAEPHANIRQIATEQMTEPYCTGA